MLATSNHFDDGWQRGDDNDGEDNEGEIILYYFEITKKVTAEGE